MAIPETEPVKNHYGNNSATSFDFDFYIEKPSQLKVQHTDLNGLLTTLKENVDYSIHEIGNENGSYITFPISGSTYDILKWDTVNDKKELLTISLNIPLKQEFEFDISGDLDKHQVEKAFDYQMRVDQILNRKINRAVLVPEGSELTPSELIETLQNSKAEAVQAASDAAMSATNAQNSANLSKEQSDIASDKLNTINQKMEEFSDNYNFATNDIQNKHSDAILDIQNNLQTAEDTIIADRTEAIQAITKNKNNAISDITTTGAEQVTNIKQTGFYMQDGKLYYINSDGETKEFKVGSMPIGMIFPMLCSSSYVPDGALPLDGTEYTKALFPNFYTNFLVAGLLNTCTYDEYASDITTYGQCGKFALDTENEKFKVPTIKDGSYLTQALSNTELGKVYNESLPNIQFGVDGSIVANYGSISSTPVTFTGALTGTSTRVGTMQGGSNYFQAVSNLSLDANKSSSTYQDNAKVQGDNVRVRYFVQVANGQINQSDMDWSAFVSALQGKLNKDHSNDEKPYIVETYVNGSSGYRLYSDGYCEQWGRISNNYQGTVTFIKPYKDTNYILILSKSDRNENPNGAAWTGLDTSLTNYRTTTQFCYINNQTPNSEWFASGYTA